MYCQVINSVPQQPRDLPITFGNVSNFYLLPQSELAKYGWFPFMSTAKPIYNEQTHKLVETLSFTGVIVMQSWSIVQMTQAEQIAFATARMEAIGQSITPYINSQVANKRYESHVSARAVKDSADPEWAQDGREATVFYDAIWSIFKSLQAGVQAGTMPLPTVEQFISSLPRLWTPPAPPSGNGTNNGTGNGTGNGTI
jgi:hypothetical protein